jgi:PAS domain S-box-containing protein
VTQAPLNVLLLEDVNFDVKLIVRELRVSGLQFEWKQVCLEPDFVKALAEPVDVILADYHLPEFDVRRALELAKAIVPDVPFLVVSGTMHEELGVELMRLGADDFLLKDRLGRLGQAVERAIERSAERRAKRAVELRLTAILEDVPVVIFSITPEGVILLAQGRGLEAFGLRPEDLEGGAARELFRGIPDLEEMYMTALTGRPQARTVHLPHTDRDVDIHIRPVAGPDGQLSQVIGVAADVTERRRAEQALLENQAKSKFLANMSHELRNPLNSVLGFAELLGSPDIVGDLSVKQARYVTHIHTAGQQLLALINDILDLSKVAAGQLRVNVEPVMVDVIIEACLTQMEPLAEQRGISLELAGSAGLSAIADAQRLMQILTNLVSNGIKFTPSGGTVTVAREADAQSVRLTVRDTGIGIAADKLEYVFDEFAQIEPILSDQSQGTGLGLPLSRRLAELQGGRIELSSEVGLGSEFTLVLVPTGHGHEIDEVAGPTGRPELTAPRL